MKKLLVFTSTFPRWENDVKPPFVYELSRRLTHDFNVSVLTPHYSGAKTFELMDNMKVYRFRYFLEKYEKLTDIGGILPTLKATKWFYLQIPFFLVAGFLALKKQIITNNPDLVHAHWIIPQGFIAALVKRKYAIPYTVTTHGGDIYGLQGKISKRIKKFALRYADRITVVSSEIKRKILEEVDKDLNIDVIPMGVNSRAFNPDKKDLNIRRRYNIVGPFLLFVGRLAEKKGIKYLIQAMPEVVKKFPKTKLLIIGDGPLKQQLNNLVKELDLNEYIVFVGATPNSELPQYYATADVFIGPSVRVEDGDREGLPVTYLEAMASGCALIGSDLEGNNDVLVGGKNALVVRQRNSEDIAAAIFRLLEDKAFKNELINNGIDTVKQKFDWNVITDQYCNLLNII